MEKEIFQQMTDQELMQQLVAENLGAWSELVSRYGNLVYAIAFKVLHNESDASDAVQNTFVRLKIYSNKFDNSQSLKPWLSQIGSREAIKIYNKKKSIHKQESSRMELQNFSSKFPKKDVSDVVAQKEIEVMINKAIELLPEISRVAITLYYMGEMSQVEIAKELGLSQFTISEKIKMGLEKIKLHLKKSGIHASLVISPQLMQESIKLNFLPPELNLKLSQDFPKEVPFENAPNITKSNYLNVSLKPYYIPLSIGFVVSFIGVLLWLLMFNSERLPTAGVSNSSIINKSPFTQTNSDEINKDKPKQILKENIYYPIDLKSIFPDELQVVKFKNENQIKDIANDKQFLGTVENNHKIKNGEGLWKVKTNFNGENSLVRKISNSKQMDGMVFDMDSSQPRILKGTIKIGSDNSKTTLILNIPIKEGKFGQNNTKENALMSNSRHICELTTFEFNKNSNIDFKIYIWNKNEKFLVATFVKCNDLPIYLEPKMISKFSDSYKFGVLSNGNIEITNLKFCLLNKEWDYHTSLDIQEKINEFPIGFLEGDIVTPH